MSTEEESDARRLCRVLKERIVEATAVRLINDFGGMEGALSFMLNDDEETRAYLQKDPDHAVCSAIDSLNLAQELDTGNETTLRLFACPSCKRSWWKRVLKRKEVSKCKQCSQKYDPIPRDKEWGIGKFLCGCGNEFTGFGEMNVTKSECYKCHSLVPIHHMLTPRRNRPRKTQAPHSCNGVDCIGHHTHHAPAADTSNSDPTGTGDTIPVCVHPMAISKIRTYSSRHISTGSTVTTFLSQGSWADEYESRREVMETLNESD